MTDKTYYLTTPLYYVNAKPHIGHAYTNVLCDTFARYRRFLGQKVFFLTGTDEHGTKIEKAAREQNKDPRTYVDEMVPQFKELWKILGIEYDFFIRTTDDLHKKSVQNILKDLEAKGEIYKASYKGWYCTPCESFWTKLQLKEGKCPDCGRDVQELSEENYFFKLSKYQDWLIKYIQDNPNFIRPEIRRNEMLGFLREPLEDLSITRSRARLSWGIDYPNSKDHVVYVWFDALINYISAVGFMVDDKKFRAHWPADLHLVGKDILRQHAVYWPIMLKACGVEMPKVVMAHGWWTMEGAKVSKSRGNAVDPIELVKKYGVDALRYFLLNEVTIGNDGAFSEDLLAERYTSRLANDLGNLWFRYASMLEKYFEGAIPPMEKSSEKEPLLQETFKLWEKVTPAMQGYNPREALDVIWNVVTRANQFVEEKKPWVLAKDPAKKSELTQALAVLGETVAHLAVLFLPFMPETAGKILERLHLAKQWVVKSSRDYGQLFLKPGVKVDRGEALFPRLEEIK
ncbi:MAG: methionine--tRNA ligase [Candidatus Omnitrophica bacterium]|nr:methionine--tRNA ligase [Candidatus Omnitrophota bacterium]